MASARSFLQAFREDALGDKIDLRAAAAEAFAHANSNASRNVYLSLDPDWSSAEAAALPERFPAGSERPPLYGVPVSLKDCFDLAGFPTSCGSRFYAAYNGVARTDSGLAARLRDRGAILTGKTHLHQLAYGITGENADYGDCLQTRDPARLTGGSSSGAAASVQEGSAMVAIGTDTGGSIRVPAALCGLAGYRSSLGLGDWSGAAHLAASFDTLGCLFRDLRDTPLLAAALFDLPQQSYSGEQAIRIGVAGSAFLYDCDPPVLDALNAFKAELLTLDILLDIFDTRAWSESFAIFAAIQASEAAAIHAGFFPHFEPAIAERLAWGASIPEEDLRQLRGRHAEFRDGFDRLFANYDFLLLPCAPVALLEAGADQSSARKRILRYTTPASLAGTPVVTIPLTGGAGVQLIGARGGDAALAAFAAYLGRRLEGRLAL